MAAAPKSAEQRGREPILRVQGVSKSFGGIAALKDVSFDMVPGEVRAICGENGAGKSTLVKIITGVYRRAQSPSRATPSPSSIPVRRRPAGWRLWRRS